MVPIRSPHKVLGSYFAWGMISLLIGCGGDDEGESPPIQSPMSSAVFVGAPVATSGEVAWWVSPDRSLFRLTNSPTPEMFIAGSDGQYFTGDDLINYYSERKQIDARTVREVTFNRPGPDGQWYTADDQTSDGAYVLISYDDTGRQQRKVYFNSIPGGSPGPDGTWLTDDDVPGSYTALSADGLAEFSYSGPGPDGTWFTSDDKLWTLALEGGETSFTRFELDDQGRVSKQLSFLAGADLVPLTADDVLCGEIRHTYGVNNEVTVDGAGASAAGSCESLNFSSDDKRDPRELVSRDDQGDIILSTQYGSAGADAQWFTADDEVSAYNKTVWGAISPFNFGPYPALSGNAMDDFPSSSRRLVEQQIDGVTFGVDGVPFNADDVINYYRREFQRDASTIVHERVLAGPDGLWFNDDDEVTSRTEITKGQFGGDEVVAVTFNAQTSVISMYQVYVDVRMGDAQQRRAFFYTGPGPDGAWFTLDDVLPNTTINTLLEK